MGYFSSNRWQGGGNTGKRVHEIALNPSYFLTHKPLELMQTIVHEMCHLWQHEYGSPGRGGYHNKEWADKMESCGLIPSSTGRAGGKRTGQRMSDYAPDGGIFEQVCQRFTKDGFYLPYADIRVCYTPSSQIREQSSEQYDGENTEPSISVSPLHQPFSAHFNIDTDALQQAHNSRTTRNKTVFSCPSCGDKAWGKPTLQLVCGKCNIPFECVD